MKLGSSPFRPHVMVLAALGAAVLRLAADLNYVDLDMFHEMALARAVLRLGSFPRGDLFAYTPTNAQCVNHEWLTGFVMYAATSAAGAAGVLAVKLLLIAAVCALTIRAARMRGAPWPILCLLAPFAVYLGRITLTTVRAQLFTCVFTAVLMVLLEHDRRGGKKWIVPWVLANVVWLNMHAGFVAGLGLVGAHWLEGVVRRRDPQWHLVAGGVALGATVVVNPWGFDYVRHLAQTLRMARPAIPEWWPIWQSGEDIHIAAYVFMLVVVLYSGVHVKLRGMPGILLVVLSAYLAQKAYRHASLFAIVWLTYVPSWVAETPLGRTVAARWSDRARIIVWAGAIAAVLTFGSAIAAGLFRLRMPTRIDPTVTTAQLVYPAGAVDYLVANDFHGHVMPTFNTGSYVMWRMYPAVKVGIDSRYDVAYAPGVTDAIIAMHEAKPGWEATLARYPTDVLLTRSDGKLAPLVPAPWRKVYVDDAYTLFARPGVTLPFVDRRGQAIEASFP